MPHSEVFNMDNMIGMAKYPDKHFDIALLDPEYGIGEGKRSSYHANASTVYKSKSWDKRAPDQSYFDEVFRVSKNQIIWGGNYFNLPPCKKYVIWDKLQPEGIDQAMCEFAWSSFDKVQTKIFKRSPSQDKNCISNGDKRLRNQKMRIHPTQKPVALYEWLLNNYAKIGDKILDPNMGSQSSRIASYALGFNYVGFEIDFDYFSEGNKRFEAFKADLDARDNMFKPIVHKQETLF